VWLAHVCYRVVPNFWCLDLLACGAPVRPFPRTWPPNAVPTRRAGPLLIDLATWVVPVLRRRRLCADVGLRTVLADRRARSLRQTAIMHCEECALASYADLRPPAHLAVPFLRRGSLCLPFYDYLKRTSRRREQPGPRRWARSRPSARPCLAHNYRPLEPPATVVDMRGGDGGASCFPPCHRPPDPARCPARTAGARSVPALPTGRRRPALPGGTRPGPFFFSELAARGDLLLLAGLHTGRRARLVDPRRVPCPS